MWAICVRDQKVVENQIKLPMDLNLPNNKDLIRQHKLTLVFVVYQFLIKVLREAALSGTEEDSQFQK